MADYYFKLLHEHEAKERGIDLSEFRIGRRLDLGNGGAGQLQAEHLPSLLV